MDIKQLITFMKLVRTLNYQKAAEQLQYAPSTLFKHIQLLEQELGVPLFCKTGRQLRLTPEGEAFEEHAVQMLDSYKQALSSVRKSDETEGPVAVGGCEINTANSLLALFRSFSSAHPHVRMTMMTSPNAGVPGLVRSEMIDLGYVYSIDEPSYPGVQAVSLYREPVFLMADAQNPIAARRKLHYEDLRGMDFVYPHDSCCFVRELLPRLAHCGVHLGELAYLGGVHLVVESVRSNNAMTLVPYRAVERFEKVYGLAALDMDEEPVWAWESIIYKRYEGLSPTARALVHHSISHARQIVRKDASGLLGRPPERGIV